MFSAWTTLQVGFQLSQPSTVGKAFRRASQSSSGSFLYSQKEQLKKQTTPKYPKRNIPWMHSTPLHSLTAGKPFPSNVRSYTVENERVPQWEERQQHARPRFTIAFVLSTTIKTTCTPQDGTAFRVICHTIREPRYANKTILLMLQNKECWTFSREKHLWTSPSQSRTIKKTNCILYKWSEQPVKQIKTKSRLYKMFREQDRVFCLLHILNSFNF